MKTLLIVEETKEFTSALVSAIGASYKVHTCADCAAVLDLLQSLRPDVLIINLFLRGADGLSLLRKSSYVPPVTIALTYLINETILCEAADLGIKKVILLPAKASHIAHQLNDLNA